MFIFGNEYLPKEKKTEHCDGNGNGFIDILCCDEKRGLEREERDK